jgi:hypothetical protein
VDKQIKIICLVLTGIFIYQTIKDFGLLVAYLQDIFEWRIIEILAVWIPIIILPLSTFLFWRRKKIGWLLTAINFSYEATWAVPLFIRELNRKPTGIPALDILVPTVSPTVYIGTFLLFGGMLWVICKNDMREVYNVNKQTMFITIGIGALIPLLLY